MSISALFGSRIVLPSSSTGRVTNTAPTSAGRRSGLVIECSSRPQKKATAHHRKTRPKKTQPWDVNRKPTVYPPLPSLPPDWSFVPADEPAETVLVASTTQSKENP